MKFGHMYFEQSMSSNIEGHERGSIHNLVPEGPDLVAGFDASCRVSSWDFSVTWLVPAFLDSILVLELNEKVYFLIFLYSQLF